METKFTKGEWHARCEDADNYAEIIGDIGTNKTIALIPKKCFVPQEEAEANAKLIEISPKMFEALCSIHNMLDEKRQRGKRMSGLEWEIHLTSWNIIKEITE